MLLAKIKETIKKYSLLSPEDRVLVAVSGGPDSVCLLAVLHSLSADLGISLHVAHLDHMFRGEESETEARFVADIAAKYGIPSTIDKVDVPVFCRERGLSPQAGAREARYAFFARVARVAGASRIATGHTATDQAETFLMRLLRGAGVSGLAAIPPKRDAVIRPLLEITREEVLNYLRSNNLSFVSDPSNTKPLYTRNRIRMDVLPVLRQFNPRIIEALASEAALLRDEDEAMKKHCAEIASAVIVQEKDSIVVRRTEFNVLQPALRRRLLRMIAGLAEADPSSLSSVQIDEALAFMADAPTGRAMRLPRGISIEREYDRFLISTAEETAGPFFHEFVVPGVAEVQESGFVLEAWIQDCGPERENTPLSSFFKGGNFSPPPFVKGGEGGFEVKSFGENYHWQAAFDYDKIDARFTIRNRRPGDWFCPSGMGGNRKKLQDFFVDTKVPRRHRDRVPLLCAGEHILWVVGFRTDERFLPGPETKRILTVTVRTENVPR